MYELYFFDTQCKSIEIGTQLEHHTLKTFLATWPFADFPYVDKGNHFPHSLFQIGWLSITVKWLHCIRWKLYDLSCIMLYILIQLYCWNYMLVYLHTGNSEGGMAQERPSLNSVLSSRRWNFWPPQNHCVGSWSVPAVSPVSRLNSFPLAINAPSVTMSSTPPGSVIRPW